MRAGAAGSASARRRRATATPAAAKTSRTSRERALRPRFERPSARRASTASADTRRHPRRYIRASSRFTSASNSPRPPQLEIRQEHRPTTAVVTSDGDDEPDPVAAPAACPAANQRARAASQARGDPVVPARESRERERQPEHRRAATVGRFDETVQREQRHRQHEHHQQLDVRGVRRHERGKRESRGGHERPPRSAGQPSHQLPRRQKRQHERDEDDDVVRGDRIPVSA